MVRCSPSENHALEKTCNIMLTCKKTVLYFVGNFFHKQSMYSGIRTKYFMLICMQIAPAITVIYTWHWLYTCSNNVSEVREMLLLVLMIWSTTAYRHAMFSAYFSLTGYIINILDTACRDLCICQFYLRSRGVG